MTMLPAQAQWTEAAKALASDAQGDDEFGKAVSISGDYAIVGAWGEGDMPTNAGAAYIFRWNGTTWTEEQKIAASDAAINDYFGYAVSISGDYAIVGAWGEDEGGTDAGAVYIFKRSGSTWTEEQKITASDAQGGDYFGRAVSISGDYAIIGAQLEDAGGTDAGAAYIFKRSGTTWAEEQKITASDAETDDYFGFSVSISGDYALVGADGEDAGGVNAAGAAYIFKRSGTTWTEEQKITASDAETDDYFGHAVSISGDYVTVGALREDAGGTDAGAAYIFKRSGSTWTEEQKITASDAAAGDNFGQAVSISGDYVTVGALREDAGGVNAAGAAYIFKRSGSTWTEEQKITASDAEAGDEFGISVSISGDHAIVGANLEDVGGANAGAAYIFSGEPEINLQGNGIDILDGDATPSIADYTDFGAVGTAGKTLSYTIQNTGPADLSITGITSDNSDFAISGITLPITVAGNSAATFSISFTPTGANGPRTANISIANDDADENPYDFTLQGYKINETPDALRGDMMSFDGIDDYVEVPHNAVFKPNAEITIEAWIYAEDIQTQTYYEIMRKEDSDDRFLFSFQDGGTILSFGLNVGGIYEELDVGISAADYENQWVHVAAVYNGSRKVIYRNGVEIGAASTTGAISTSGTANVFIGSSRGIDEFFNGQMDEVRFWSVGRTETQIRENMHLTLKGSEAGLEAYYQFNEASGDAIDKINGNNGTLTNGAIRAASEVAVAGGTSKTVTVTTGTAGTDEVDLSTTDLAIDFGTGTNPNGDLVIYQLNERPHTPPAGVSSTSRYWVVRNFGTNTTGLDINALRFRIPAGDGLNNGDVAADFNLYKQGAADFNNWGAAAVTGASSVDFPNREIAFSPTFGSFSQLIVGSTGSSTLPVELLNFQAQRATATQVALNWSTATEINASHFEIERMLDNAEVFTKVGEVTARGNTNNFQAYAFQDANAHQGLSYYRLKQVDEDGSFEYSEIRAVAAKESVLQIAVFPNPVDDVLKLRLSNLTEQQQMTIRIVNSLGQVAYEGQRTFGQADVVEIPEVSSLTPGAYYLQLKGSAEQLALPFVKR